MITRITFLLPAPSPSDHAGRSLSLLDPTYASKYIPIIASVSEHQPPTWSSYFTDINVMVSACTRTSMTLLPCRCIPMHALQRCEAGHTSLVSTFSFCFCRPPTQFSLSDTQLPLVVGHSFPLRDCQLALLPAALPFPGSLLWQHPRLACRLQVLLMPLGLLACFRPLTDSSLFLILYGVTAAYFSGVMVGMLCLCHQEDFPPLRSPPELAV